MHWVAAARASPQQLLRIALVNVDVGSGSLVRCIRRDAIRSGEVARRFLLEEAQATGTTTGGRRRQWHT